MVAALISSLIPPEGGTSSSYSSMNWSTSKLRIGSGSCSRMVDSVVVVLEMVEEMIEGNESITLASLSSTRSLSRSRLSKETLVKRTEGWTGPLL